MTLRSVARTLRAPRFNDPDHGDAALCEWLDQVGKSRGVSASCTDFLRAARTTNARTVNTAKSIPGLFENAEKIYDWKQEILKNE